MKERQINVILYGNLNKVNFYESGLKDFENIKIVSKINIFEKLEEAIREFQKIVIVTDFAYISLSNKKFFKLIVAKDIKSVGICRDVTTGFYMLKEGMTEMLKTPLSIDTRDISYFFKTMSLKIKAAYSAYFEEDERVLKNNIENNKCSSIIAIGASMGGTEAIAKIMETLPPILPPIIIIQHMPPVFTKLYADRLNQNSKLTVWEAKNGDEIKPGLALVAPGGFQLELEKKEDKIITNCVNSEKINGHCPSIDVTFNSIVKIFNKNIIGVLLTGMGSDGAKGLLSIKHHGGFTIGQDEESSVVYGMPQKAYNIGAVTKQLSLEKIAKEIMHNITDGL